MKKSLIVIAGATACGKTETAIALAKKINGEIISADSMQVYRYMNIGTAKPTLEEMQGIQHYLIDTFYPDEEFNVYIFQKKVKEYMNMIYDKNKIPILVGGTGFYINSIVYDNNFMTTNNSKKERIKLEILAEEKGNEYLFQILKEIDPESAKMIHPNNVKRVIRAIEFFHDTGITISSHNKEEKEKETPYQLAFFILNRDRTQMYQRIDQRVDLMIKTGLVDKVKFLLEKGYTTKLISMQGLGYKEIAAYIQGNVSLESTIYELKKNTRHFAKRQLTWFRRQCDGQWLDLTDTTSNYAIEAIYDYLIKNDFIKEL